MEAVIGIDEVGRGPLAGPVAVGTFQILHPEFDALVERFPVPLQESKHLSRQQREAWFRQIEYWQQEGVCDFAVAMASAQEIDRHGISKAIRKALAEALDMMECGFDALVLLDGALHAPPQFKNQITIVHGDEREKVIALASIVAKVLRDRHMRKLAERYPQYGFEQHMGYATDEHHAALKRHGPSPVHRKSFLRHAPRSQGLRVR
jgi:ribonuclease HII